MIEQVTAQPTHTWSPAGVKNLQMDKAALREARIARCWEFYNAERAGIIDFLAESLLLEDWETETTAALQHLVENFHRFGGKTRGDFLLWAARRLSNRPALKKHATLRDYIAMGIDDFDDAKSDLSDFKFTEHLMPFGKEYHIPLEDGHVWRIRDLRYAKGLWPVHIKKVNGKPYVVKVVRRETIFVHRLLFDIKMGDVIRAFDGDFTNMSLYPFSRHTEAYWADWKDPKKKMESKDKLKLIRADGTKPIYTKLTQQWVPNLYIAHNTAVNASAQDRQDAFEDKKMRQPLEVENEDGDMQTVDFGGTSPDYLSPVSTADVVRPIAANKNTPATWEKLDREGERESAGVRQDMTVATIREANRDADRARTEDEAGEERAPAVRASLVDDVEKAAKESFREFYLARYQQLAYFASSKAR